MPEEYALVPHLLCCPVGQKKTASTPEGTLAVVFDLSINAIALSCYRFVSYLPRDGCRLPAFLSSIQRDRMGNADTLDKLSMVGNGEFFCALSQVGNGAGSVRISVCEA